MLENNIEDALKLNYTVIAQSIGAQEETTSAIGQLAKINNNLGSQLQTLNKTMSVLISGFNQVLIKVGGAARIEFGEQVRKIFPELAKQVVSAQDRGGTFAGMGLTMAKDMAHESRIATDELGILISKTGSNDDDDDDDDKKKDPNMLSNSLGAIADNTFGMMKSMMFLQPLLSFIGGLLSPFKILSRVMEAMGRKLSIYLVPIMEDMLDGFMTIMPLIETLVKYGGIVAKFFNPIALIGEIDDAVDKDKLDQDVSNPFATEIGLMASSAIDAVNNLDMSNITTEVTEAQTSVDGLSFATLKQDLIDLGTAIVAMPTKEEMIAAAILRMRTIQANWLGGQ